MKNLSEENIKDAILNIIYEKFGVKFDRNDVDSLNINLLNEKTKLKARDLLVLFYELEKCYSLEIPVESVIKGEFKSISSISNIIYSHLAS